MYFANMYCYGHDNDLVGVTGIIGCMGLVYVGAASIYAVHIPDNSSDLNALGGKTFTDWVKNQEAKVGKGHGQLFAVLNGANNRATAMDEVKAVKKALNSPATIMYHIKKERLMSSGSSSADAVVTIWKRVHATPSTPSGTAIHFKPNSQITWQDGGKAPSGQYKIMAAYTDAKEPSDMIYGWGGVNDSSATATVV